MLDQIRALLDTKIDKLETDLKTSIGEVKTKIDDLNIRHSESNERLTAVEAKVETCNATRIDQGRRLGEIERDLQSFRVAVETEKQVRGSMGQSAGNWVRFLPAAITGLIAVAYFVEKMVRP
jgi:DNA repair exonuclease SbcCD ATPase subunit